MEMSLILHQKYVSIETNDTAVVFNVAMKLFHESALLKEDCTCAGREYVPLACQHRGIYPCSVDLSKFSLAFPRNGGLYNIIRKLNVLSIPRTKGRRGGRDLHISASRK